MALVNLTCASCDANEPCASCRSIAKALRAAGHSITQSSRYDALRAATVGTYGFEACILPIAPHERAIVDAARQVLDRARVALLVEPGGGSQMSIPSEFTVIESSDWRQRPFPTNWIAAPKSPRFGDDSTAESDETRLLGGLAIPADQLEPASRRLKGITARIRRDISAAGFPEGPRLDLLAALEDEIAWSKMSGSCFGLVLVVAPGKSSAPRDSERALAALKESICATARASDIISQGSDSLLVILAEAALEQTDVVAGRIKKAVRKAVRAAAGDELIAPALRHVRLGTSVYPTHGTTRAALLARATASAEPVL
jgi:hypothetical protein